MSGSQRVFPDVIKIENIQVSANSKVNYVAAKAVQSDGGNIGKNSEYNLYDGLETESEVKLADELNAKIHTLIEKQGIKQYGSSMKILILLGGTCGTTQVETYTPGSDGILRDPYQNIGAPGASIMKINGETVAQTAKDVQAAIEDPDNNYIEDPDNNYKVLSAIKMR